MLAAEVHNFNAQSADITFGLSLQRIEPVAHTNSPPTITTQPQSLTVTNGDNASFTVVASGNPAPTYQWRKGGTNISGATSPTYGISGVTTNDAGGYDVLAANSSGSVTSMVATLTVVVPVVPSARIDLNYSGNTITLSWDAPGFVLQSADSLEGTWTNVAGNPGSPFPVEPLESKRFYRLRR